MIASDLPVHAWLRQLEQATLRPSGALAVHLAQVFNLSGYETVHFARLAYRDEVAASPQPQVNGQSPPVATARPAITLPYPITPFGKRDAEESAGDSASVGDRGAGRATRSRAHQGDYVPAEDSPRDTRISAVVCALQLRTVQISGARMRHPQSFEHLIQIRIAAKGCHSSSRLQLHFTEPIFANHTRAMCSSSNPIPDMYSILEEAPIEK